MLLPGVPVCVNLALSCLDVIKDYYLSLRPRQRVPVSSSCVHRDNRCYNKFYEVVSHSSSDTKTKGVLILVQRTLNITILDKGCDTDGRITHIKTIVENRNIVFLSVYAPCTPDPTFFSVLSTYLLKFLDFEIVLGADTNSVMSYTLDRSGPKESHSQSFCSDKLRQCVTSSSLVDSWCLLNPSAKFFTFFSATHKSYS